MSDGQYYTLILAAETILILTLWWATQQIRRRRARTRWLRQLEQRRQRTHNHTGRRKAS